VGRNLFGGSGSAHMFGFAESLFVFSSSVFSFQKSVETFIGCEYYLETLKRSL
jgi:hypothetical protein